MPHVPSSRSARTDGGGQGVGEGSSSNTFSTNPACQCASQNENTEGIRPSASHAALPVAARVVPTYLGSVIEMLSRREQVRLPGSFSVASPLVSLSAESAPSLPLYLPPPSPPKIKASPLSSSVQSCLHLMSKRRL